MITENQFTSLAKLIKFDDHWFCDIIYLIQHYYAIHPCGGSLHVVLDDQNIEDDWIHLCYDNATKDNDIDGMQIANLMLKMTSEQRERIVYSGLY